MCEDICSATYGALLTTQLGNHLGERNISLSLCRCSLQGKNILEEVFGCQKKYLSTKILVQYLFN